MKYLKNLIGASVIALSSFSATASDINVGGVVWDPEWTNAAPPPFTLFDFIGHGNFFQTFVDGSGTPIPFASAVPGSELEGFGQFTTLNEQNDFCPSCLLTLEFGGFVFDSVGLNPNNGEVGPLFTGGWATIYVDTNGVSNGVKASYTDGVEWLELMAAVQFGTTTMTLDGTLTGGGNAEVFFNVMGGPAMGNFDTDGEAFGTDIHYTASAVSQGGSDPVSGSFDVVGNTIPEPSSIALCGLSLLGLAGAARRKQS